MASNNFSEFQGLDELYIAEVIKDDNETDGGYVVGDPIKIPAAEISVSTSRESAAKYYDNAAFFIAQSEGDDEATLTVPQLPISLIGKLTGKTVDEATGALLDDGEPRTKYFAIGYRLRFLDGTHRYVWRLKGSVKLGDEAAKSLDGSTDSNNQQLTYTGTKTIHKFAKTGAAAKAVVVDEREGKADVSTWFDSVVTPDTVKTITPSV